MSTVLLRGCKNSNVDFHSRHSLSAGGPGASSAPLRLWGLPWTRFSRRSLAPSVPINFVLTIRNNHFCLQSFLFYIRVLKLEVMTMLSKHNSIQRDQLEMITLDQLVPANHLVRKIEGAIDFTFIYDLVKDMYSEIGRPSIDPSIVTPGNTHDSHMSHLLNK